VSFARDLVSYLSKLENEGKIKVEELSVNYELPSKIPEQARVWLEEDGGELVVDKANEKALLDTLQFQANKVYITFSPRKKLHPLLKDTLARIEVDNERKVDVFVDFCNVDLMTLEEYVKKESSEEEIRNIFSNILSEAGYKEHKVSMTPKNIAKEILDLSKAKGEITKNLREYKKRYSLKLYRDY